MLSKKTAMFTIIQNEDFFLDIWLRYYKKFFPAEHIYILNHSSTTESCLKLLKKAKEEGINVVPVYRDLSFDHAWLRTTVEKFQSFLFSSYDYVAFTEVDEILTPNPAIYDKGLGRYILEKFNEDKIDTLRCAGFNVEHDVKSEGDIDLSKGVLQQRFKWRRSFIYDKPLISKVPCRWVNGFHSLSVNPSLPVNTELILIHLHKMDYNLCKTKHMEQAKRKWNQYDVDTLQGDHNRIYDGAKFDDWFFGGNPFQPVENFPVNIPEHFKGVV